MEINKASVEIQVLSSDAMLSVGSQEQSSVVSTSQKSCCWWNAATQDDNGCWFIFDSEYWNITLPIYQMTKSPESVWFVDID